jgi:hypothetical protein
MKRHTVKTLWFFVCGVIASLGLFMVMAVPLARVEGTNMPGTIIIKYVQKQYAPVTFDHALHTTLAGSCGKCHHMHNEEMNSTCSGCHSLNANQFKVSANRGFPPCRACHKEFSPKAPNMPGLKVALHKKCFECHVGIGELGASPEGCVKTCHARK